jgi:hypothetical protein
MRQDRQKIRRFVRPLVAAAIACLLFQQALALVFSHARHSDIGDFISSPVALASELCADKGDGDGKASHVQHMHCLACFLSEQDSDPGSKILFAAVVLVLEPRSDDLPYWVEQRDVAPSPAQWPSNRLSRAPPSLLS